MLECAAIMNLLKLTETYTWRVWPKEKLNGTAPDELPHYTGGMGQRCLSLWPTVTVVNVLSTLSLSTKLGGQHGESLCNLELCIDSW